MFLGNIGNWIVPSMILLIIVFAVLQKTDIYSAFTEGTVLGAKSLFSIFPALLALFISIGALRASGLLDLLTDIVSPIANWLRFPSELVPFAILRPVSGSGSLAFAEDIFSRFGPDSPEGRIVSVMMGSTETTFYTTAVYFAASGTKNIRHTLKCALCADAFSMAVSVIVCNFYF